MNIKVKGVTAGTLAIAVSFASVSVAFAQDQGSNPQQNVQLTVPTGVPLRLYLTKRVPKHLNAPVEAKLLTPIYAFDNEVIPAAAQVLGHVSQLQPVSKWDRIRAVLGGDFTPLHIAQIEFTSLLLSDGRSIELHTLASQGLNSLVPLNPPKQRRQSRQASNSGIVSAGKQKAKDQMDAQIDRVRSIPESVRGTDKKEWLYDFAMSKLPYHTQYVHNRTRFDAELQSPLDFGAEKFTQESLALLGSQPIAGSIVHARLITPLDSLNSKQGDKVQAVLEQPLFSADHRVVLPEGTIVDGSVAMVKKARLFHRGGHLRFNFQSVDLEPRAAELIPVPAGSPAQPAQHKLQFRTQAALTAAEGGSTPIKVDKEGEVQATESKTRFIGTAVAVLIARSAADNDPIRSHSGAITGQSQNVGGRTLGGGMGFGLLGSIASQSSRNVGTAFGYYGLAWSVYSTVIARGAEVHFGKNAVIDIGFNQRTPTGTTELKKDSPAVVR